MAKLNTKTKKWILAVIIAVALIAIVLIGVCIYKNMTGKLYSGDGIYYSQQDDEKYLQFKEDKTFTFATKMDENTEDISKGTWTESNNVITLTFFENNMTYKFIKTESGYLYREDKVFRGKTSDEKLLNNRYVLEKDGEVVEEIWFMKDGTVDYQITGDSRINHGTYTRVDDILIVRYNKNPDVVVRFLVLDNGITKEIFHKEPPKEVAH